MRTTLFGANSGANSAPAGNRDAPDRHLKRQPTGKAAVTESPIPQSCVGHARPPANPWEGLMHKLSRREALRGTRVAYRGSLKAEATATA